MGSVSVEGGGVHVCGGRVGSVSVEGGGSRSVGSVSVEGAGVCVCVRGWRMGSVVTLVLMIQP